MEENKSEFLHTFFEQIESQIQFGDNKASLLIAGNALLLAITGGVMKMVSGCPNDEFTIACMAPSGALALAAAASICLIVGLFFALWAARPASVHDAPPPEFFLMSYIAKIGRDEFVKMYRDSRFEDLVDFALITIHSKAGYSARKFRYLRRAIHATVLSLIFLFLAVVTATIQRIASHV